MWLEDGGNFVLHAKIQTTLDVVLSWGRWGYHPRVIALVCLSLRVTGAPPFSAGGLAAAAGRCGPVRDACPADARHAGPRPGAAGREGVRGGDQRGDLRFPGPPSSTFSLSVDELPVRNSHLDLYTQQGILCPGQTCKHACAHAMATILSLHLLCIFLTFTFH